MLKEYLLPIIESLELKEDISALVNTPIKPTDIRKVFTKEICKQIIDYLYLHITSINEQIEQYGFELYIQSKCYDDFFDPLLEFTVSNDKIFSKIDSEKEVDELEDLLREEWYESCYEDIILNKLLLNSYFLKIIREYYQHDF
jgi:hypothetical protein